MAWDVRRCLIRGDLCIFRSSMWQRRKMSEVGCASWRTLEGGGSQRQLHIRRTLTLHGQVPGLW